MSVHSHRQFRLGFGAVYIRVGGSIKNNVRRISTHHFANLVLYGQIDALAIAGNEFTSPGEAALQLTPNLTVSANDEDSAQTAHAKTSASRSLAPLISLPDKIAFSGATGHGMARSGSFQTIVRSPTGQ